MNKSNESAQKAAQLLYEKDRTQNIAALSQKYKEHQQKTQRKINLYYRPYDKQIEVHKSNSRYKVVCCGRRCGKTTLATYECLQRIKQHKKGPKLQIGWVSPNYQNSLRGIDSFKKICRDLIDNGMMTISGTAPYLCKFMGHKIYFLTADNPDALRGYFFDFLVIDEAAFVSDKVYFDVLKPTLMDKSGELLAISTPQGRRGFFYELYLQGIDQMNNLVSNFSWTTYDNPYIAETDVEDMKSSLPHLTFRQEVLAEFVASDNQVIQDVSNCFDEKKCSCNCAPIMGCDLAKSRDYTVMITLCPQCFTVKNLIRHNHIPWGEQQTKIVTEYNKQRARRILIDATGIGSVVIDNIKDNNIQIEPVIFTNSTKNKMISDLIVHLEQGKLRWSNTNYPIIAEELLALERKETKTSTRYEASSSFHDDVVMALALALKGSLNNTDYHIISLDEPSDNEREEKKWQETATDDVWEDVF